MHTLFNCPSNRVSPCSESLYIRSKCLLLSFRRPFHPRSWITCTWAAYSAIGLRTSLLLDETTATAQPVFPQRDPPARIDLC